MSDNDSDSIFEKDLAELTDDELERLRKMLDITKLQQEIQQSHEINMATIEKMRVENDKFRSETKKIDKEAKFYPWILLLASMGGGLVVAILNNLLK